VVLDSKVDKKSSILFFFSVPEYIGWYSCRRGSGPTKVIGFDPNFKNPRSFQASASVETAIGDAWSISGGIRELHLELQRRLDQTSFRHFRRDGMPISPHAS